MPGACLPNGVVSGPWPASWMTNLISLTYPLYLYFVAVLVCVHIRNLYNLANTWSWMCVLLWFVMKLVGDFHLDCIKVDLLYFWVAYIAYSSCHSWDSNGDPGTAWSSRLATFAFIQRISQPGPSFDRTLQILAALITSGAEMHFHHAKSTGTCLIFFGACEGWMQTGKLCWGHRPARPGLLEQDQGMVSCAAKAQQPISRNGSDVLFNNTFVSTVKQARCRAIASSTYSTCESQQIDLFDSVTRCN